MAAFLFISANKKLSNNSVTILVFSKTKNCVHILSFVERKISNDMIFKYKYRSIMIAIHISNHSQQSSIDDMHGKIKMMDGFFDTLQQGLRE